MRPGSRWLVFASFMIGLLLLTAGLSWTDTILPRAAGFMGGSGDGNMTNDPDMRLMEGKVGLPRIFWDALGGREMGTGLDALSPDMFETGYKEVYITGEGVFEKGTGEFLFGSEDQVQQQEGETFPMGGVDKRDYDIFNQALNRTVTARYRGEEDILGRTAYAYALNISRGSIDDFDLSMDSGNEEDDIEGEGTVGGSPLPIQGETELFYYDYTEYLLDPATSIPLDLRLDTSVDFVFPDATLLQVSEDEQVTYSEEQIWVPDETIPGRMESVNVIKETHLVGRIDGSDPNIAVFTEWDVYYDSQTGEPLESQYQGDRETYAVDRSAYLYVEGYMGTQRSGYHTFPVGGVKPVDYEMWDEMAGSVNTAEYTGIETVAGVRTYHFEMHSKDIIVEGGNFFLPIYRHPGTSYEMDMVQEWFIDPHTGLMLDYRNNGTFKVASSGPLDLYEQSLGSFEVDLPKNTTEALKQVVELYRDVLIPMSGEEYTIFSMDLSFTEEMKREMVDIAKEVEFFMDLFLVKIPNGLLIAGTLLAVSTFALFVVIKIKERKTRTRETLVDPAPDLRTSGGSETEVALIVEPVSDRGTDRRETVTALEIQAY